LYFDEDCGCYKECYKNCLTCSKKEISEKHMNCLTCDSSKGFNYFKITANCLNCKSLGKYVDYEKTECIDKVPDGYYINDTEINTIDKCHKKCLTCVAGPNNDDQMNCLTCDNTNGLYLLEGTNNCVNNPYPHHFLDIDKIIKPCHYSCKTCSVQAIMNKDGDITNCDSCNNDLGFYPIFGTKTCINGTKDGLYFDEDCKCYKKCYDNCLSCSEKEINKYHMNCLTCDSSKGFTYFKITANCLNCKSLGKYVDYEKTECIDKVPDGYYVDDENLNTIDKCYEDCKTCSESSTNSEDMKCLKCYQNKQFYFIENTHNCHKYPYQGYYLEENILKKCYSDCLTCSAKEVMNGKGKIINMNCDSCDESKGLYLTPGTKNCEEKNKVYDNDNCPEDKPVAKNNNCDLTYCTTEEYENKICNISNPVIKKQWIDDFPYVIHKGESIYSTLGRNDEGDLFFEANIGNPFSDRKIYTLKNNGRGYMDGILMI